MPQSPVQRRIAWLSGRIADAVPPLAGASPRGGGRARNRWQLTLRMAVVLEHCPEDEIAVGIAPLRRPERR